MSNENNPIEIIAEKFEQMAKNQVFAFFEEETLEELADYYINLKHYRKAIEVTNLGRQQHPYCPTFLVMKAQIHIQMGENQVALEILAEAEKIEPFFAELHMTRGSIYSQMGLHDKSISAFRKAGEYDAPPDEVDFCIAYELVNLENWEDAIPLFRSCLAINPDHDIALNELAFCYEMIGDQEEGVEFFEKFTDKRPYNPFAWFNLGVSLSRNGLYEKALEAYEYALAINDKFPAALFNKANLLSTLNRVDEAIACYNESLTFEPQRADTHYFIGECYERKEDLDTALLYYHKATRLDANLADAWLGIGVVLEQQDRISEGIHYVKKALDLNQANAEYWYAYGDFQLKLGFHEEAEAAYKQVMTVEPENPNIWLDYAKVQFEMENMKGSLETLMEGIKHHPVYAELQYRMAAYLIYAGRKEEALEYLHDGLHQDFDKHEEMFEEFPQLRDNLSLVELIESYRK
ncbi:MAG TPA: tetratricopeptide repeat protein [Bacteroidia bacterium]|nr:tetratricopeptide repeat protein [Bacteroidia bacterium]